MQFSKLEHNLPATPLATPNIGTIITGGGANTKGNYSSGELIASTTYDSYMISVIGAGTQTAATATNALLDIGIGASGSESTIIENLAMGWTLGRAYNIPIYIPKGTRIAARCQGQIASETVGVAIWLHSGPSNPPWPVFSKLTSYGADTATSSGLAHTPGTSGAESTWTNIGSTLAQNTWGFMLGLGFNGADTTLTAQSQHWEVGINSTMLAEFGCLTWTNEEISGPYPDFPYMQYVASGTQMMIRAESSGTPESMRVILYGLS